MSGGRMSGDGPWAPFGGLLNAGRKQEAAEAGRKAAEEVLAKYAKSISSKERSDDLLTSKEVAPLLGVTHHKTVERWVRERDLPCVRIGRNLRFRRGDVLRWQAQQEG